MTVPTWTQTATFVVKTTGSTHPTWVELDEVLAPFGLTVVAATLGVGDDGDCPTCNQSVDA